MKKIKSGSCYMRRSFKLEFLKARDVGLFGINYGERPAASNHRILFGLIKLEFLKARELGILNLLKKRFCEFSKVMICEFNKVMNKNIFYTKVQAS